MNKETISKEDFKKQNRRAFLYSALAVVGGYFGFRQLFETNGERIPPAFRKALHTNGEIAHKLFSPNRPNTAVDAPAPGTPARVNGKIGLNEDLDLANWQLDYKSANVQKKLSLAELQKMPRASSHAEFRCIEGWSMPFSYAGVRFSDFLQTLDPEGRNSRYVGLETPEGTYYVSIDMDSMLHPQTILADEMNGSPLGPGHGEPLRLIIPVKYGIKNLKRIGKIFLSDELPPDYWAENGYDWYAGL